MEPRSATKSVGSETSDSLLQEIAANGVAVSNSPGQERPVRDTACRGVALRRYATRRRLFALSDDDDLFDDGTKEDGFSPNKSMAQLKVKDEVIDSGVVKQERHDADPGPWGGQPALDPWTQPGVSAMKANIGDSEHYPIISVADDYL